MKKGNNLTKNITMNLLKTVLKIDFTLQSIVVSGIIFSFISGLIIPDSYFIIGLFLLIPLGVLQLASAAILGFGFKSRFHIGYFVFAIAYLGGTYLLGQLMNLFLGSSYRGENLIGLFFMVIPFALGLYYYGKTYHLAFEQNDDLEKK